MRLKRGGAVGERGFLCLTRRVSAIRAGCAGNAARSGSGAFFVSRGKRGDSRGVRLKRGAAVGKRGFLCLARKVSAIRAAMRLKRGAVGMLACRTIA